MRYPTVTTEVNVYSCDGIGYFQLTRPKFKSGLRSCTYRLVNRPILVVVLVSGTEITLIVTSTPSTMYRFNTSILFIRLQVR